MHLVIALGVLGSYHSCQLRDRINVRTFEMALQDKTGFGWSEGSVGLEQDTGFAFEISALFRFHNSDLAKKLIAQTDRAVGCDFHIRFAGRHVDRSATYVENAIAI